MAFTWMKTYNAGDIDKSPAPIYMRTMKDVNVQLYNNSTQGSLHTFSEGASIEIIGRRRGSADEYLIAVGKNKYAYMHLTSTDYYSTGNASSNAYTSPALYAASVNYGGAFEFGRIEKNVYDSESKQFFDTKAVDVESSTEHFNEFMGSLYAADNADVNATTTVDAPNNDDVEGVDFDIAVDSLGDKIVTPTQSTSEMAAKVVLEPTIMSYGLPPQWTKYVDPRVTGFTAGVSNAGIDINIGGLISAATNLIQGNSSLFNAKIGLGRRYTSVTISNPTILELAPGFMKYTNWLKAENIVDNITKFRTSDGEAGAQELIAEFAERDGSFYTIKPCFANALYSMVDDNASRANQFGGYMSYVNILMGIAAVFLSRSEVNSMKGSSVTDVDVTMKKYFSNGLVEEMPPLSKRVPPNMGSQQYSQLDWSLYDKRSGILTIGGVVIGSAGGASNSDTSSNAHGTAFDYIKFYLSGSTTAQDQFQTSVEDSFLGQLANTLNTAVKEAAYWANSLGGGLLNDLAQGAQDIINAVKFDGGNPLQNVFAIPEMLGGAKLVFPQIITESRYGKSITCQCTFPAIYGDEEAIYVNTLRPYLHLLAFVLPHQVRTSLDMYTFPFIVKAFSRGLFNVEMGAITGFNVNRGGQDETLWSFNGASEVISVEFEITPLINQLVMSSAQDGPGWTLKNKGLQEYLSAISAFDARNDQFELALDIFRSVFSNYITAKISGFGTELLQKEWVSSVINLWRQATYGEGIGGIFKDIQNTQISDIFNPDRLATIEQTWNDLYVDGNPQALIAPN